jgi:hypothetical protein
VPDDWRRDSTPWKRVPDYFQPGVEITERWVTLLGAGQTLHEPRVTVWPTEENYHRLGFGNSGIKAPLFVKAFGRVHLHAECDTWFWSPFWVMIRVKHLPLLAPLLGGKRKFKMCEKCEGLSYRIGDWLDENLETVPREHWGQSK